MAPKFTTQSAREAFDEICERAVLSEKAMDALARLGRELAELQQATRWQPIETAPRDGTFVLLSGRDLPVWQGSWVGTSGRYAINGWTRFNSVDINWNQTHGEHMKATLEVELQPFQVPNFVRYVAKPGKREDGFAETLEYPLSDLDPMTLWRLCEDFKDEVFRKSGKEQPPSGG